MTVNLEDQTMEDRKTLFDYAGQVFIIFGFSIVTLNLFCVLVGEYAQDVSSIYSMGNKGLSTATMMQFLGVSVCITGLRFLFFTDRIIRQMSITMRTVCMLLSIIVLIMVCVIMFGWFPIDMWQPWAGFLITFALCFAGSMCVTRFKEKSENRKMEEALQRLKEQDGKVLQKP